MPSRRKPCKSNQVRNRSTGRCRLKSPRKSVRRPRKSVKRSRKSVRRPRKRSHAPHRLQQAIQQHDQIVTEAHDIRQKLLRALKDRRMALEIADVLDQAQLDAQMDIDIQQLITASQAYRELQLTVRNNSDNTDLVNVLMKLLENNYGRVYQQSQIVASDLVMKLLIPSIQQAHNYSLIGTRSTMNAIEVIARGLTWGITTGSVNISKLVNNAYKMLEERSKQQQERQKMMGEDFDAPEVIRALELKQNTYWEKVAKTARNAWNFYNALSGLTQGRRRQNNLPIGQVPELPPVEAVLVIEAAPQEEAEPQQGIIVGDEPAADPWNEGAIVRELPEQCGRRTWGTPNWPNDRKGERCRAQPNPRNCVWSKHGRNKDGTPRTRWTCHEPDGRRGRRR